MKKRGSIPPNAHPKRSCRHFSVGCSQVRSVSLLCLTMAWRAGLRLTSSLPQLVRWTESVIACMTFHSLTSAAWPTISKTNILTKRLDYLHHTDSTFRLRLSSLISIPAAQPPNSFIPPCRYRGQLHRRSSICSDSPPLPLQQLVARNAFALSPRCTPLDSHRDDNYRPLLHIALKAFKQTYPHREALAFRTHR